MKASEIINQMKRVIPFFSDRFTDEISVSSLTRIGSTVTAVTATVHGLSTNEYVFIKGAYAPTNIATASRSGNIVSCTTATDVDITYGFNKSVIITGFNESEYNGTKTLLSTADRRTFTYEVESGLSTQPTGTGVLNEELSLSHGNEDLGYNGYKQVTVTDTTTFTYTIDNELNSPATGAIFVSLLPRVSGAITLNVARSSYEEQNTSDLWAFVVLGNPTASKDRYIDNDLSYVGDRGWFYFQKYIQPFSVHVFKTCTDVISARSCRDLMEDVRADLYKVLLMYKGDSGFTDTRKYGITAVGDGFEEYNNAFYVHTFDFEINTGIYIEDTLKQYSVAMRNINIDTINDEEVNIKEDEIDYSDNN